MRLHRFYISSPLEHTKEVINDDRLLHQWRNVFRYNVGSEVILFDGSSNEYDSVIERLGNREAEVRLVSERKGKVPEREIILFQSLIKKDKMEWAAEKATELGVSKIVPVISERSEKKGINMERLKKIVIEASEQCGRADVPMVEGVRELGEGLWGDGSNAIVFDPSGVPFSPSTLNTYPISLFVGPEGGWSEREIEKFKDLKIEIFSLGKLTLRAETAAIAALSKFAF